jgi:3-deoxy-manno-octulosonate cytidylyltransferase (CMP-KDO synthetase)
MEQLNTGNSPNSSPSVVIVIPARYASTRFPGKPLADIAGKPMIQWVWERCHQATLASEVLVATDDDKIKDAVESFGGIVVMTDPELASGTERIAAAAQDYDADIYVNVQGDEPLIPPETIDASIRPLLDDAQIDIGTAAVPISDPEDLVNPNIIKVVCDLKSQALYFSRSPIPFLRDAESVDLMTESLFRKHIGIYAFRKNALERFSALAQSPLEKAEKLEQLRALQHGMRIHVAAVMSSSIAVDVPDDVEKVLQYLSQNAFRG